MNSRDFDRLLDSIRTEAVPEETVRESCARVRTRMEQEMGEPAAVGRIESCADFQGLYAGYRKGNLSEARRMLLEDHLHSCVKCRREFQGSGKVMVMPRTAKGSAGRRVIPWAMAAAAAIVAGVMLSSTVDRLLAGSGPRGTVASVDGALYRVTDAGLTALAAGAAVGENEEIRTSKGSRAVVRLRDGSTMEMAERSDLRISERWSGKRVRLERGSVMVEAAKQRRGRLEISTPDCLVSVKGTIFEVSRGTKGSRVSVVEGEVKVDRDGATDVLHRGDQTATNPSMATTPVAQDVGWSRNAAKYLALLGEFSAIQKRIEAMPGPGLRYESKLAGLLPENTMVFAAIPNLGSTLAEATGIFEERVQQSAALREWWNQKNSQQLRAIVDQVRTFSDYLGDEVVLAVPAGASGPMLIAEARRPGLKEFIEQKLVGMKAAGRSMVPQLIEDPQTSTLGQYRVAVMVDGNVIAVGGTDRALAHVAAMADAGGKSGFLETPFWQAIAQRYQSGAEWIFAADMEQIVARHVPPLQNVTNSANLAGLDNVRYLMIERKQNLGRTENSAALSFSGARHGMASWLAAPGPMGTLDFVSPDASFAASFVLKSPGTLLEEVTALVGSSTGLAAVLGEFHVGEIAANLGSEMTVAVDGPLLPTPSWKIAIEVNDPVAIEQEFAQAVGAARKEHPEGGLELGHSQVNGRTYYTLSSNRVSYEIDYVFTDGYLLMAPSAGVLTTAIEDRSGGVTLERSAAFRAQLPQDGHVNFSALLYYNLGAQIGPVADQLKSSGLMTPAQQQSLAALTANREPGLIYAYGAPDRIVVASRSGFFGLGLDTLVGLNAKGAGALGQLVPSFLTDFTGRNTRKNAVRN